MILAVAVFVRVRPKSLCVKKSFLDIRRIDARMRNARAVLVQPQFLFIGNVHLKNFTEGWVTLTSVDHIDDPYSEILNKQIDAYEAPTQSKELPKISYTNPTILIVDDDPDALDEMNEALSGVGYNCITATNAMDALHFVYSRKDIAIILTDLQMPGADGLQLTSRIKKSVGEYYHIRIIVVSAFGKMSDVQNAMREGVSNFLTKPVLPNKLIEAIENECKQIELDKQKFWDV